MPSASLPLGFILDKYNDFRLMAMNDARTLPAASTREGYSFTSVDLWWVPRWSDSARPQSKTAQSGPLHALPGGLIQLQAMQ